MKKFNSIREESLLEKLKASDPTGKWISDFVHSDNPKFAGKSKKERIRMALGASYAAKRNEEVEIDEALKNDAQFSMADVEKSIQSALKKKTVDVQTLKPRKAKAAVMSAKNSKGYVTSKAPPGVREDKQVISVKDLDSAKDYEDAQRIIKSKEPASIEDRSRPASSSAKPKREEEPGSPTPPIEDRSRSKTVKETKGFEWEDDYRTKKQPSPDLVGPGGSGMGGGSRQKKEPTLGEPGAASKMNMGRKEPTLDAPKEKPRFKVDSKGYPVLTDKMSEGILGAIKSVGDVATKVAGAAVRAGTKVAAQGVGLNYDPGRPADRSITVRRKVRTGRTVYEGSQLDQLKTMQKDPQHTSNPEHKAQLDKRVKMAQDRADLDKGEVVDKSGKPVQVLPPSEFSKKNPNFMKEDDDADYKHSGQGISKDMQMARDIAHQKAVQQMMRSKHGDNYSDKPTPKYQPKYSFEPGEGGTYKATARLKELPEEYGDYKENILNEIRGRIRLNIKEPTPSAADRLYASQQKIRKEKGLPDPSEYKKMGAQKQKEIKALKTEAKKMKGKDPCWDNYKMIGTKMKGGKQVPNCVPEEVELVEAKPGLYANIHAKRKRIERGSGERMRKPGTKGAPTAQAFKDAAKTAKK